MRVMITLLFTILVVSHINANNQISSPSNENTRPIIGILTQPAPADWKQPNRTTYLAASYVKYIEATGAQVVPILMYQSSDYYSHLFNSLDGILLPGGNSTDEYFYVAQLFYTWAVKAFDETQKNFPIWGTCLGFETLLELTRGSTKILERCQAYNYPTEVTFMPDANDSRLLGSTLPLNIRNALENEPITVNLHNFCMRPQNFTTDPVLSTFYKMLTISADLEGKTFVSAIESRRYPFFGVQWHPEKNGFEWRVNSTYPHGRDAVHVSEYLANFFTDQVRENTNQFDSLDDEVKYSIYQYTPQFTDLYQSKFQQIYLFHE